LYDRIRGAAPEALLIGGDIGEAHSISHFLDEIEELRVPTYFVLGNHDFYRGSISQVRSEAGRRVARYLPVCPPIPLGKDTVLIGHDGWADGRIGNYAGSDVMLNDYFLIRELEGLGKQQRLEKLHALGDEAAAFLERQARAAFQTAKHVIVLTHVPPFQEACWHEGKTSDEDWLPHFTCKAVGARLRAVMEEHPDCRMTVLCGHTHSPGFARILPNLEVYTGESEYGEPAIQRWPG
jgi:Icc-related predicted phosphoesterase